MLSSQQFERMQERCCGKERGEGTLARSSEKVPRGFGLRTGDQGGNTPMVLGTEGGLPAEHGLLGRG